MSKVINIYKFDLPCRLQVYEMYFKTFFSFKMGQPRPLFVYFRSFSNKHYKFLQQIDVKKCPSSIQCRDSNPRPLECESPPKTTRPGLPSLHFICLSTILWRCSKLCSVISTNLYKFFTFYTSFLSCRPDFSKFRVQSVLIEGFEAQFPDFDVLINATDFWMSDHSR